MTPARYRKARLRRDDALRHRDHADRKNVARGHRARHLFDQFRRYGRHAGARAAHRVSQSGNRSRGSQTWPASESSPRDHLDGESAAALPLDIQATAFQRRVWEALKRFRAARQNRTARSPPTSAIRKLLARWHALAPRIQWRWRFLVIAWCAKMAAWAAIAGAWIGSESYWR